LFAPSVVHVEVRGSDLIVSVRDVCARFVVPWVRAPLEHEITWLIANKWVLGHSLDQRTLVKRDMASGVLLGTSSRPGSDHCSRQYCVHDNQVFDVALIRAANNPHLFLHTIHIELMTAGLRATFAVPASAHTVVSVAVRGDQLLALVTDDNGTKPRLVRCNLKSLDGGSIVTGLMHKASVYVDVFIDAESHTPLLLVYTSEGAVFKLLEEVKEGTRSRWKTKRVYTDPIRGFNGRIEKIIDPGTPLIPAEACGILPPET
jgi:hypothetical protein